MKGVGIGGSSVEFAEVEAAGRVVSVDRASPPGRRSRVVGRTTRVGGAGDGDETPLEMRTKDELYRLAKERSLAGRGKMSKEDLIRALGE